MNAQVNDRRLLERVAARDRRAFDALYQRYYRRLFGYLFKVTRRAELVEEILNDVMFVVWRKAGAFAGRSKPSTWILGIAYRRALKALAKQPRGEYEVPDPEAFTAPEHTESLALRRELRGQVGKAMRVLSPEQRAVVELAYYHELPYPEIAEIVGCPVNTVKTRMFHARRKLREVLPDLGAGSAFRTRENVP